MRPRKGRMCIRKGGEEGKVENKRGKRKGRDREGLAGVTKLLWPGKAHYYHIVSTPSSVPVTWIALLYLVVLDSSHTNV